MNSNKQAIVFAISFIIIFLSSVMAIAKLPGSFNQTCVIGAYFTPANVMYNAIISCMVAFIISNIVEFGGNIKVNSSMLGILTWATTTFCVPCMIPLLSFLGISVSLSFLSYNNLMFQMISIVILSFGVYESIKLKTSKCMDSNCEI